MFALALGYEPRHAVMRCVLGASEAVIARFQIVPAAARDKVHANPQAAIEPDILEMVRARTPEVPWLYFPLSKRLFVIEALIDANSEGVGG